MTDDIRIERDDERSSYLIKVGDAEAGYAHFVQGDGEITFDHTHVDPNFAGQGLAGALVKFAVTDATARGSRIVPVCSYVQAWVRAHDVPGAVISWPEGAEASTAP
ncbi:MAG: N-acetyltransferase [Microbacteriaceae bacterium]|nr:N-acetyltransferase [Microthrixaceae bacterium]NLA10024.1 N-acetyltransferase [Microbacteriaceae bacterium]